MMIVKLFWDVTFYTFFGMLVADCYLYFNFESIRDAVEIRMSLISNMIMIFLAFLKSKELEEEEER